MLEGRAAQKKRPRRRLEGGLEGGREARRPEECAARKLGLHAAPSQPPLGGLLWIVRWSVHRCRPTEGQSGRSRQGESRVISELALSLPPARGLHARHSPCAPFAMRATVPCPPPIPPSSPSARRAMADTATVYVTGLDSGIKRVDLLKHFGKSCGAIERVTVINDSVTGRPKARACGLAHPSTPDSTATQLDCWRTDLPPSCTTTRLPSSPVRPRQRPPRPGRLNWPDCTA